jgi:drug/metabolite transporter (DMT)-like permease
VGVIQDSVCEPPPRAPRRPAWLERETTPALLAALVTVVLWASAFVGIRSAGRTLSPGALALGRLLVASIVLLLIAGVRRELVPRRPDVRAAAPALVLCGLLWFAAYNVALNAGERRVDAGTAAMLIGIGPILIAVVAGFALREGFPRWLLLGCAIAFCGVVVIGLASSNGGSTTTGVALCLAAACAYAVAVVLQKSVIGRLSPLQTTLICCVVATVACLPFAPQLMRQLAGADGAAIGWTIYLGAFPTAIAFTTWAFALARTSAGKLGATTYLVPPLSVLLGWLVLSEAPPAPALLGGALCLLGVGLARRGS